MKETVRYINARYNGEVETVDEFPYNTRVERMYFYAMLKEYRISDRCNTYYSSQRCTKDWNN